MVFALDWGLQWGRRAAIDLEASALEGGASLRDLPMREAARLVCAYFADRGWGSPSFDFAHTIEGLVVVELARSALAESAGRSRAGQPGANRACHLLAGALAGILSTLADHRLAAREVACAAGGAQRCAIVVVGHERRGAVDGALGGGARGVEPIRAALRLAPRAPGSGR